MFGSGKSYLLAVIVVILTRVLADRHRILITSTTNVAVDNILIKYVERIRFSFVSRLNIKKITNHANFTGILWIF